MKISIFWFRRDLRLDDNIALNKAIESGRQVKMIFIFDENIIKHLPFDDPRVSFIHQTLFDINTRLMKYGASLEILKGNPYDVWSELINNNDIAEVFINKDYEPYAIARDSKIKQLLNENNIKLCEYKDQVIFEESEIVKKDGKPYLVYTPYKNKWYEAFNQLSINTTQAFKPDNLLKETLKFPELETLGFKNSHIRIKDYDLKGIPDYHLNRDYPAKDATSYLSVHLRFGTVSIRKIISEIGSLNDKFINELIWREFFKQIMFHFPDVAANNFNRKYDAIKWRNDEKEFELWCRGETGYPLVDAGMRQLNSTGYMHNRVRMITAGFLCKHLLIDWGWGESYFAEKLFDYDLSSNNGNWQWAAGTGCDAAPYFRIFNPMEQQKKFDRSFEYVRRWLPEYGTNNYPAPIVEHRFARNRAIETYKSALAETR